MTKVINMVENKDNNFINENADEYVTSILATSILAGYLKDVKKNEVPTDVDTEVIKKEYDKLNNLFSNNDKIKEKWIEFITVFNEELKKEDNYDKQMVLFIPVFQPVDEERATFIKTTIEQYLDSFNDVVKNDVSN